MEPSNFPPAPTTVEGARVDSATRLLGVDPGKWVVVCDGTGTRHDKVAGGPWVVWFVEFVPGREPGEEYVAQNGTFDLSYPEALAEERRRVDISIDVPKPADSEPLGVHLTREQLEDWAGPLTDDQVERLDECIPNSSIPEAIGDIVGGMKDNDDQG